VQKVLAEGVGACPGRACGRATVILPGARPDFRKGDVLVIPSMLFGDWLPYIRDACAVVTDRGGRRSHAAVAACELGIPCIVGTKNGTAAIRPGSLVTVDAIRGQVLSEDEMAPAEAAAASA